MSNDRVRGVQVHRPVIYGSHARFLTEAEKQLAPAGHTHKWTVFINSATSPPPGPADIPDDIDALPGGADDLSYFIKKVTFKLHETYPTPSRVIDKPPFRVSETGWGEFTVQLRIQFVAESSEKPLVVSHPIKLHHWGAPLEPSAATATQSVEPSLAPTPTPAAADGSGDVKMEDPDTPLPPPELSTPAAPGTETILPGDAAKKEEEIVFDAAQTAVGTPAIESTLAPLSVAARFPVHSWQYDEIVFSDPPRQFLDILNANPPTPFPLKSRRPKDQREEYENRKKVQGSAVKVGSVAPSVRASRAGTMDTGGGTPAPQVGIVGEPGSADVPLEFTQEMVKGEFNAMTDARLKIVDQMDRWRERLIALEKELAKAKEEVKATPI